MDSEIFRSTLSDKKFASFHYIKDNERSKWKIFIVTLISYIILPGLVLSYGVIAIVRCDSGHPAAEFLIIPCAFSTTWTLTDLWFYNMTENGIICSMKTSLTGVLLAFIGVFCNAWNDDIIYHTLFYGICAGAGTGLVLSQINYLVDDMNQTDLNKMRSLSRYCQAIGQITMPYICLVALYVYGHTMGYLLISGVILQILPFTILLKNKNIGYKLNSSGYDTYRRAYSLFDDDLSVHSNLTDVPLTDLSKKSWRSPSDENLSGSSNDIYSIEEKETIFEQEDEKLKNLHGVEILPQILEENEDIDDEEDIKFFKGNIVKDPKRLEKSIKRLSAISDTLDDIITTQDTNKESEDTNSHSKQTKFHEVANSRNTMTENRELFPNTNPKQISCCSFNKCYKFYRSFRNTLPRSNGLLYSLKISLKTWQFYPALMSKTSMSCLFFFFSSLTALLGRSIENKLDSCNITFIISVYGISWLSVLMVSPLLNNIKKSRFKIISSFGSITSSLGLFVMLEFKNDHLLLPFGAAITGIGCGAISISDFETSKDCIGIRKWPKLKATLNLLSVVMVTGMGIWMTYLLKTDRKGVYQCFQLLSSILFLSGVFWLIIIFVEVFKKHKHNDHYWPHM